MGRRKFTPEFRIEAVKLVRERGVSVRQAAADLGLHENVLRSARESSAVFARNDPRPGLPGGGGVNSSNVMGLDKNRMLISIRKAGFLRSDTLVLTSAPRC